MSPKPAEGPPFTVEVAHGVELSAERLASRPEWLSAPPKFIYLSKKPARRHRWLRWPWARQA